MKSKLLIFSFTLLFFNSAHAICVPRNSSTPSPSPHTPPNLKPVSSSPSPSKSPTPSSPAPKSSSSSSSPKDSAPAPKSSAKDSTPSSPAPKSSSKDSTPSSPAPKSSSKDSTPSSPAPKSSPKDSTPSAPAPKSSSPKDSTPSSPAPKASSTPSQEKSPSPASSTDSTPSTIDQSFLKRPILNTITSALPKPGGNNPAIKKICDSTDYPDICLSTLGPLSGPSNDVSSVLGVAIKAGLDFSKIALDTAGKLAGKPGTPPDEASSIKDCKDSYDDVSYNFQNAADALPKKDIGTMNTMLSAALTDVGDCQDAFEGQDSPLSTISDQLKKMASNCLAIVDLLNK